MREARSIIPFICSLALILLPCRPGFAQELPASVDQAKLNEILETAGEYYERLKGMALHFVCHEAIAEKTYEFDVISRKRTTAPAGFGWIRTT